MSYTVIVLPEAEQDADRIYEWIVDRSQGGADSWYTQFLEAIRGLASKAEMYGLAPESEHVQQEIRQLFFKTRKGLRYRVLFAVAGGTIYVLHVRGPGQPLLGSHEIREP
jgi:plasmid stabilization system protein ParE